MSISDVLHHLVDNSRAFDAEGLVQAHKDISDHFGDEELHHMVPSPEAEAAASDEKAGRIASLRAELAALEPAPAPTAPAAPAPAGE
jgi:hypothetical protein